MIPYPSIDPIIVSLGWLAVRWYGLMYVIGFAAAWWLGRRRAAQPRSTWTPADVDDLIFFAAIGVILGGRLGWILFYAAEQVLDDPLTIIRIWEGGMSFHGGLIGVIVAVAIFASRRNRRFADVTDFLSPLPGPGILAGRIGNFINGELWGRVTDVPWGMVFPDAGPLPRHPSQLYESVFEGWDGTGQAPQHFGPEFDTLDVLMQPRHRVMKHLRDLLSRRFDGGHLSLLPLHVDPQPSPWWVKPTRAAMFRVADRE